MYAFKVNGVEYREERDKNLLEYLRKDLGITSAKEGCGEGACGTCMVLVDGKKYRACVLKLSQVDRKEVITVEGLSEREKQVYTWAFGATGAVQCGFCIPGMVISAKALLDQNLNPTRKEIKEAIRGNICRCTGYVKIEDAIEKAAWAFRENYVPVEEDRAWKIGEAMPRVDAKDKVLGVAKFVDDLSLPGMLYGAVLRSPVPRGLVKKIDVSEARAMEGVEAVITWKDIPGKRIIGHLVQDWPVLVAEGEETRYVGDALALVVAKDVHIARDAVKRIKVDIEELKPILTPEEALAPDAPKIHPWGNTVEVKTHVKRGNVDEALAKSAHVVTRVYQTQRVDHAFMEPESALAEVVEDGIVVYTGGQGVYDENRQISAMLGIPADKVRCITAMVGGGFGGKEDMSVQHHAALMAWITKKPVKLTMTREESLRVHPKRHPMRIEITSGCDEQGRLTAHRIRITSDTGAYTSLGGPVLQRACTHAGGPYVVPNIDIEGIGVYTNNPPCGAFRGFGVTQSAFAVEGNMNLLAEKVGISYWEIRWRNAIEPGAVMSNGQIAGPDVCFKETLLAAKEAFESSPYAGIACGMKNSGLGVGVPDVSRVRLEVRGGKVQIYTSAACMGQGIATMTTQIVSHVTGIPVSKIQHMPADTKLTPDAGTSTASRQTVFTGEATRRCAELLRQDLLDAGSLEALEGKDYYQEFDFKSDPMGSDKPNPVSHIAYGYATHVAILDEEGRLVKYVACHDSGQPINIKSMEGQIEGGIVMGMGYALTEEFPTPGGYPVKKYGTLGLWRAPEVPPIEVKLCYAQGGDVAFGAKGVGEISLVPPRPRHRSGLQAV
ncbi:LOW QUALITY PROTEIN: selenium-dependent molybdenum hydroxylase 1 [Thermanaerovibrio velox DSM 12556]|uniref:Selenium-dependent molybdenum hydroxylase 1 n=1 Tax=Thermanaerovibrio velox DSM 12556 TaxID=926567 RepID=H0UNZ3_9BACT|nr:LOW QUALITY PROTEIN: selenium-dependent molybdenum hydroxylase 1 [Thermanaerovibrio velox DSM 12556]